MAKKKQDEGFNPSSRMIDMLEANPLKLVQSMISEAEPILNKSASRWKRYRTKYRAGLQHLKDLANGLPTHFPVNYIFANVETAKANVPRSLPSVVVKSIDVDDKLGDGILSKMISGGLERARLRDKLKNGSLHHATLTGLGWLKVPIDDEAYFGQPDTVIETPSPESILVDPNAIPFYDGAGRVQARYIIERRRNVSVEEVEALFGVEIDLGKPDDDEDDTVDNDLSANVEEPERIKPSFGKNADLFDAWINTFDRKKPWWRVIIWGNKVIKEPHESPYDHPYPPYIPVWIGYDDGADDFYEAAIGEVEEIEPLQDKANLLDKLILKSIRQVINRQRVVNKALGLSVNNVDNTEGRIYAVPGNPKEAIHWDNPQMLTTDVYTYRMMIDYGIEVVSGITGTQAGRKPTGIQAAKALQTLSANSDRRSEDRRESIGFALERVAEIYKSNMFQFWSEKRLVETTDGAGVVVIADYPEALQVPEGTKLEDEQMDTLKQQREQFREENGIGIVLADLKRNATLRVTTNTPLPEDRAERTQMVVDLVRLGLIDRESALDSLDWPDRYEVIQRLGAEQTGKAAAEGAPPGAQQQAMMEQAMMQMQQQMAPMVEQLVMQILSQVLGGGGAPPQPAAAPGDIPPEMMAQYMRGGD